MPEKKFSLDSIGTVSVYKRSGSRSIRLSFTSSGEIRITIPKWLPYQSGLEFVLSKKGWIAAHRPEPRRLFNHNDKIGKAHRLVINPREVKSVRIKKLGTEVHINHPPQWDASSQVVQQAAEKGAKQALKAEAEKLLPLRLSDLALSHGFKYSSVKIKQLKSKWGSCDRQANIVLNYYLMQLPWRLIDYVLVHELVHTKYLNHSPEFWKSFEAVMPGAKKARQELRHYKTTVIPEYS